MTCLEIAAFLMLLAFILFAYLVWNGPHCCARCGKEIKTGDLCLRCQLQARVPEIERWL